MLGADVVVTELQRLTEAELEHLLGTGSERDVPGRGLLSLADDFLDLTTDASREIPNDSSDFAATPSPSWMRPRRMCSVPM